MAILPYYVDVPMSRVPVANFLILAATSITSVVLLTLPEEEQQHFILAGGYESGWLLHLFAHANLLHLAGNMLFLWVFGNAVCAKVGNLVYPVVYVLLGLAAASAHVLLSGQEAVGASGAINAVVGMFVVWFTFNDVRCLYWFYGAGGTFSLSGVWLILFWLVLDVVGAIFNAGSVAYWAHLGGFLAGFCLAWLLLLTRIVRLDEGERSLAEIFS